MEPPSTSGDCEDMVVDVDETSDVARHGLASREGQLLQGITSLQTQLDAVSQRQDELMGLIGALREQDGLAPGPPRDFRGRTASSRGSVSYATSGPIPPTADGRRPTSDSGLLPPFDLPPNHPPQPPPHPDRAPGLPNLQRIPTSQAQGPEKPPLHPLNMNRQPLNPAHPPLHPSQRFTPHLGHSVPVFGQLQNPMGQVVGLVHRGSFTVPGYMGAVPSMRHVPAPHMPRQVYPHMQHRVHPQMPPQMNPQIPPHGYPQMQPHVQMRGPMPTNWDGPPGPPPPYPGPDSSPEEPTLGGNQAGPSTAGRRTSRRSGTRATSQTRDPGLDQNGDQEDGDVGLDVLDTPRREVTGRVPTRANPARRARPTQLRESD